jgi:nucleoid-associated protein YgaU
LTQTFVRVNLKTEQMFGSDIAMYMNEQLFHRPVNSTIAKQSFLRHHNSAKLSKIAGLLAAILIVLIISLTFPILGGEQDALAASSGSHVQQTVEIAKGDTLWNIAHKHTPAGTDVREYIYQLKALNGLKTNLLFEGQILILP